jgi:3-deoxy-D-manno-octulosonic-acid transferase
MSSLLVHGLSLLQSRPILKCLGVREKRISGYQENQWDALQAPSSELTWFHASSLGELEMLAPLIEDHITRGIPVGITAFSDSALTGLLKFRERVVFAELSPRESQWAPLLKKFRTGKIILGKYDFWPGMLEGARELGIPVIVINAEPRSSLLWYQRMARWSGGIPKFHFFTNQLKWEKTLQTTFPSSVVHPGVDPRYERVSRRLEQKTHPRFPYWTEQIQKLKGPIGIVGSAWAEDLEILLEASKSMPDLSWIIVPHDLTSENVTRMKGVLSTLNPNRVLFVIEMGLLTELYSLADFAFVGGGFYKGIHSTIEPALSSIPVAAGPQNFDRFPETRELSEEGVLTCCKDASELKIWLNSRAQIRPRVEFFQMKRSQYQALLEDLLRIR